MKLDNSTLAQLALAKPTYDRSEIAVGIVHFGVGGFHRAHQAMYIDRLLEMGLGTEWGICGVGVMPADRRMAEVMADQDGLYTLLLEKPDGTREARDVLAAWARGPRAATLTREATESVERLAKRR